MTERDQVIARSILSATMADIRGDKMRELLATLNDDQVLEILNQLSDSGRLLVSQDVDDEPVIQPQIVSKSIHQPGAFIVWWDYEDDAT